MKEVKYSQDQLYKIIGAVYAEAFLRIETLEADCKRLLQSEIQCFSVISVMKEEKEKLTKALEDLRSKEWNNGNANFMLPESLPVESPSKSTV